MSDWSSVVGSSYLRRLFPGHMAKHQMTAHRMADQHVRPFHRFAPVPGQGGGVLKPDGKIRDMADARLCVRQTARPALVAPVERGQAPTTRAPGDPDFQIFYAIIQPLLREPGRSER